MEKRVLRTSNLSYTFDFAKEPVLTVKEGESFIVETEDNLTGALTSEEDLPVEDNLKEFTDFYPPKYNPVSGPIYIEGAERGDLLQINIEEIIPGEIGISCIIPGFGPLSESRKWPELNEAYTKVFKHIPGPSGTTRDGKAIYDDEMQWDLQPFIGTIGVATDYEIHSSLFGQGPVGGNWDSRDMKEGSKIFLNCFHKGGLLYVGDVHASQGDTEWTGVANEVKAELTLSCKIHKNKKIPYARIEKEDSIISLYADKPMEEAVHQAIINLMDWMITDYGVNPRDAYIMISTNPNFRINIYQMIRCLELSYVVGAEYPKSGIKKQV